MNAAERTGLATANAVSGLPVNVADLRAALTLCAAQIECAARGEREHAERCDMLANNCATQGARDTHEANARKHRESAGCYDRTAASARAVARAQFQPEGYAPRLAMESILWFRAEHKRLLELHAQAEARADAFELGEVRRKLTLLRAVAGFRFEGVEI